jgi:hypothetical protein
MIGLLPQIYSKILKREKLILRIFLICVFTGFIFLSGLIFLLPSYFSLVFSLDDVLRSLNTEEVSIKRKNVEDIESKISSANFRIDSYFTGESKRKSFSELLLLLIIPASDEIKLTSIEFKKSGSNEFIFYLQIHDALII